MKSPLKKEPPKRRWVYKALPQETWKAIGPYSPDFVVRAIAFHEELIRALKVEHEHVVHLRDDVWSDEDHGNDKPNCNVCEFIAKAEGKYYENQ